MKSSRASSIGFVTLLGLGIAAQGTAASSQVHSSSLRSQSTLSETGKQTEQAPTSAGGVAAAPVQSNALTVEEIVTMNNAQVGDDAIIAKIKSSGAHFDLSPDQMIRLRKQGISGPVLAAMVSSASPGNVLDMSLDSPDPNVPHPPGVYALLGHDTSARMIKIDPTMSSQMKTGGIWGYALTGGIASMSMKVSIPGANARVRSSGQPVFYFFFDDSRPGASASSFMGSAFLASSPNEFSLVRLDRKGDHREAKVGKMNIGGAKVGVMDKDRVTFAYDQVRPGVFKVALSSPLPSGEYGFLYSLPGTGMGGAASARIFDFGIN